MTGISFECDVQTMHLKRPFETKVIPNWAETNASEIKVLFYADNKAAFPIDPVEDTLTRASDPNGKIVFLTFTGGKTGYTLVNAEPVGGTAKNIPAHVVR